MQTEQRSDRRWLVAGGMVGLGALLMLAANLGAGSTVGGLGALTILLSAIPLRRLGWRLLLYVPAAYVGALVASFALVGAGRGIVGSDGGSRCEGWNRYIGEVNAYSPTLNARLDLLRNRESLTDDRIDVVVGALENDIANWRAADPPRAATALNEQMIVVLQGWADVFRALGDGTYSVQMLFDLQRQDDEFERLNREANAACAG